MKCLAQRDCYHGDYLHEGRVHASRMSIYYFSKLVLPLIIRIYSELDTASSEVNCTIVVFAKSRAMSWTGAL